MKFGKKSIKIVDGLIDDLKPKWQSWDTRQNLQRDQNLVNPKPSEVLKINLKDKIAQRTTLLHVNIQ